MPLLIDVVLSNKQTNKSATVPACTLYAIHWNRLLITKFIMQLSAPWEEKESQYQSQKVAYLC